MGGRETQPGENGRSRTSPGIPTWKRKNNATPEERDCAATTDEAASVGPDGGTELRSQEAPIEVNL